MQVLSPVYSVSAQNWYSVRNNYTKRNNNVSDKVSFTGNADAYKRLLGKFTNLFMYNADGFTLPNVIREVKYTDDRHILGFKVSLNNGNQLVINKFFPDKNRGKTPYLAIKEFGNGAFRDFIGVDLRTQDLIYLERATAKPVYQFGQFKKITLYDDNHAVHESRLESWLKEIFPDEVKNGTNKNSRYLDKNQPQKTLLNSPVLDNVIEKIVAEHNEQFAPKAQEVLKKDTEALASEISKTNVTKTEPQPTAVKSSEKPSVKEKVPSNKVKRHRTKTFGRVPASLSAEIQSDIRVVNDIMDKLSKVREKYPSPFKRAKLSGFKNNYKSIIYTNERTNRGVTFKFGEDETLKVTTMERKPLQYLCIIHTDKAGNQNHILIENGEKVVVNTRPLHPSFIPVKTIHCTKEEMDALPIDVYVKFLRENLEKYYSELSKVLESDEPIKFEPAKNQTLQKNSQVVKQPEVEDVSLNKTQEMPDEVPQQEQALVESIPVVAAKWKFKNPSEFTFEEILAKINSDGRDEKIVELINQKAVDDAKKYAKQYMDMFVEQFKKSVEEQMSNFKEMFAKLFNN